MGETRPVCSFALWVSPRSFSSSWKGLCRRCRWPLRTRDDTRWHQMTPINGDVALKAKSNLLRYKWCFFISHVVKQCETLRNGQLLRTLKDLEKDLESIWTYLDIFGHLSILYSEDLRGLRSFKDRRYMSYTCRFGRPCWVAEMVAGAPSTAPATDTWWTATGDDAPQKLDASVMKGRTSCGFVQELRNTQSGKLNMSNIIDWLS